MSNKPKTLLSFQRIEKTFWWIFFLFPIFTGLLAYHWLPNESFDENQHIMISSHEVCDGGDVEKCGEMADEWKDRDTGKIYSRADFAIHRDSERWRMLYVWFGYGLIGCFFYGYARWRDNKNVFFEAFGKAICINIAVALLTFFAR